MIYGFCVLPWAWERGRPRLRGCSRAAAVAAGGERLRGSVAAWDVEHAWGWRWVNALGPRSPAVGAACGSGLLPSRDPGGACGAAPQEAEPRLRRLCRFRWGWDGAGRARPLWGPFGWPRWRPAEVPSQRAAGQEAGPAAARARPSPSPAWGQEVPEHPRSILLSHGRGRKKKNPTGGRSGGLGEAGLAVGGGRERWLCGDSARCLRQVSWSDGQQL